MTNILEAIVNLTQLEELTVSDITFGNNRATNVGDGLETFMKDVFANALKDDDKKTRIDKYQKVFSYQGSSRTPPDLMIKSGDAIEVKKTESLTSELQLNSSHPKAKLFSSSSLINKHCKECENWIEKDFIYAIGHIPKKTKSLSSLWLIDGSIYAADQEVYLSLKESLTEKIESSTDINFSPTNEIGRVNSVDPLKITNLRIRGMWLLQPPFKVFDYVHEYDKSKKFQCICILPNKKYNSYPNSSQSKIENNPKIKLKDIKVQDPNNPSNMIDCKLIKFNID